MVRYSILLWFIYLCVCVCVCVRAVFCGSASNILLLFLTEVCAVVFIYCVVNVFNKWWFVW